MGQQPVPPPHQLLFYPPQQQPYYQPQPPMGAYGAYPPPQAGFYQYQTGPPPPGYNVVIFFSKLKANPLHGYYHVTMYKTMF